MRGKRRVLATLVIGELMFAFGEGGSSSEAIRDQDSTRVFRPVRAVSLTLPTGKNQARATRSGLPRVCESWQTAWHKMGHLVGVALATTVLKCVPRTFSERR